MRSMPRVASSIGDGSKWTAACSGGHRRAELIARGAPDASMEEIAALRQCYEQ